MDNLYRRCIELGKGNISQEDYAYLLSDYGDFLSGEKMYAIVERVYVESLNIFKELNRNTEDGYSNVIYWNLNKLSEFYINSNQYETADKCLKEIWQLIKDSCDSSKKGETLYHLAYLHSKQLKKDLAEKELRQAIQILESEDSEYGRNILKECFYHIGLIHKNDNKLDLAREEAKKALSAGLADRLGCSWTSRFDHLWPARPRAGRPWRQWGSVGTHTSDRRTPPGHIGLSPASIASLHPPVCTLACKASVYKSG